MKDQKTKKENVILRDDTIVIYRMDHPSCVTSFIRKVNLAIKRKKQVLTIKCECDKSSIFPDACLPIAALIQNYKKLYNIEFNIIVPEGSYLKKCDFETPQHPSVDEIKQIRNPLDKIFMYTMDSDGQVANLVQSYIDCISRTTQCEDGVLSGLIWCINEVMDNVLVHSKESTGYIMAQYHRTKKNLAICVYDCGTGIYNSLYEGEHKPKSEIDALTMALQEGVGDGLGQGNGLFGLFQIVSENGGKLIIASGKSSIVLKKGELDKYENGAIINENHPGTIVDFQLNLSKKIDIKKALKSLDSGVGFDGFDIRIDNMWQDDNCLRYDVYEHSSGTGTRKAGEELRNDVLNIIRKEKAPIVLDFKSVHMCSSSFIDEFVAKMMLEMGVVEFTNLVKLDNMNDEVSHLCERSIFMRVHKDWQNLLDNDN